MARRGDFSFATGAGDYVEELHSERSKRARNADEAKRAPITTDAQLWASDPSQVDFPGVDTPTETPNLLPKDLMQSNRPETTPRARNEPELDPIPASERERSMFKSQAGTLDISLSPEEALEGVGSESQQVSSTKRNPLGFGLASDMEADLAFSKSEEKRLFEGL